MALPYEIASEIAMFLLPTEVHGLLRVSKWFRVSWLLVSSVSFCISHLQEHMKMKPAKSIPFASFLKIKHTIPFTGIYYLGAYIALCPKIDPDHLPGYLEWSLGKEYWVPNSTNREKLVAAVEALLSGHTTDNMNGLCVDMNGFWALVFLHLPHKRKEFLASAARPPIIRQSYFTIACLDNDIFSAQMLLEAGVDPSANSNAGLVHAARHTDRSIFYMILEHPKFNINAGLFPAIEGALHIENLNEQLAIAILNHPKTIASTTSPNILKRVLKHPHLSEDCILSFLFSDKFTILDWQYVEALLLATSRGFATVVQRLVNAFGDGYTPMILDDKENTELDRAIIEASRLGDVGILKILLEVDWPGFFIPEKALEVAPSDEIALLLLNEAKFDPSKVSFTGILRFKNVLAAEVTTQKLLESDLAMAVSRNRHPYSFDNWMTECLKSPSPEIALAMITILLGDSRTGKSLSITRTLFETNCRNPSQISIVDVLARHVVVDDFYLNQRSDFFFAAKCGLSSMISKIMQDERFDPANIVEGLRGAVSGGHLDITQMLFEDDRLDVMNQHEKLFDVLKEAAELEDNGVILGYLLKDPRTKLFPMDPLLNLSLKTKTTENARLLLSHPGTNIQNVDESACIAKVGMARILIEHGFSPSDTFKMRCATESIASGDIESIRFSLTLCSGISSFSYILAEKATRLSVSGPNASIESFRMVFEYFIARPSQHKNNIPCNEQLITFAIKAGKLDIARALIREPLIVCTSEALSEALKHPSILFEVMEHVDPADSHHDPFYFALDNDQKEGLRILMEHPSAKSLDLGQRISSWRLENEKAHLVIAEVLVAEERGTRAVTEEIYWFKIAEHLAMQPEKYMMANASIVQKVFLHISTHMPSILNHVLLSDAILSGNDIAIRLLLDLGQGFIGPDALQPMDYRQFVRRLLELEPGCLPAALPIWLDSRFTPTSRLALLEAMNLSSNLAAAATKALLALDPRGFEFLGSDVDKEDDKRGDTGDGYSEGDEIDSENEDTGDSDDIYLEFEETHPFFLACERNHLDAMKILLSLPYLNPSGRGNWVLWQCIGRGLYEISDLIRDHPRFTPSH
ncbi:hypothetical protein HDU97_010226 [Phlyctochytrium planicorne]|nr:hypothetical protein HDU97_010226 [Phlyctochytrium planicorne]